VGGDDVMVGGRGGFSWEEEVGVGDGWIDVEGFGNVVW